ncbi:hypothetical protein [Phaeacidiphilus oryzae]|uniref:hypothetical protein n=1 Tax=Phaeacidiphilus oryzae TaxID=348818 RepID=UPI00068EFAE5|nr:hypothetical protein [Phaeacidiphilus oryzae]
MLTRFRALRGGLAARAAVTVAATAATTALAFAVPSPIGAAASAAPARGGGGGGGGSGSVSQCQIDYVCTVAKDPGSPGSASGGGGGSSGGSGGGGGMPTCSYQGKTYACEVPGVGVFDSSDGCYYQQAQPQPPAGDIAWQGHQPGDGAVYTRTCLDQGGGGQIDVWRPRPPAVPGAVVRVNPADLARQALQKNPLPVSQVELAPADKALVGMPIWLWLARPAGMAAWPTAARPLALQPVTAGGTTVTVEVWITQVVWDMGDGHTVSCNGPGTPYQTGDSTPDCGYQGYGQPSANQPGHRYPVNATVQWAARWRVTAGGNGGGQLALDPVPQRAGSIEIDELQVLNN